jgi:hypothetical protein
MIVSKIIVKLSTQNRLTFVTPFGVNPECGLKLPGLNLPGPRAVDEPVYRSHLLTLPPGVHPAIGTPPGCPAVWSRGLTTP